MGRLCSLLLLIAMPSIAMGVEERVQIPASGKYFLTVIVPENSDAVTTRLGRSLASDAMKQLDGKVWRNTFKESHPFYQEKIRPKMGDSLPMVVLQKPNGEIIYAAAGSSIPGEGAELYKEVAFAWKVGKMVVKGLFKRRPCVDPNCPVPTPVVVPVDPPEEETVFTEPPPIEEEVEEPDDDDWAVLATLAALVAAGLYVFMRERG